MKLQSSHFFDQIKIDRDIDDQFVSTILSEFKPTQKTDDTDLFSIDELEPGAKIQKDLLLNDYEVKQTKTNKQFLRLSFSHVSGMVQAKMWDNQGAVEKNTPLLEKHALFTVEGVVDEFNGFKSLTVNRLTPLTNDQDPFTLLPSMNDDSESLTIELFHYFDTLNEPYKSICYQTMRRFWHDFRIVPAAKGFHHNYLGGLLKHTVGLMRIAHFITHFEKGHVEALLTLIHTVEKYHKKELYSHFQTDVGKLNQSVFSDTIDHLYRMTKEVMKLEPSKPDFDQLITAILFHDLGKMLEYDHAGKSYDAFRFLYPTASSDHSSKQGGIQMDPYGVMIGHIPYGVLLFTKLLEKEEIELSLGSIHEISHMILAHHGLPEWGSAVKKPQTINSYLIHIVDYLDSRYDNVTS
ncbi:3'-5' exoribonuclease [Pelagirhabdus alkalitolerans]|uniref:3'-5' exoribonuclease n=1 Tax=Pelagirhabdus alkalitolerans TaxID=1612202 RepID=A0A1G6NDY2_9BACI|nr:HD domain-containing protein [Pelagirhabdus alkalitolerans]SDC65517.1 3'-5' exoribonuclease [Pelagirhabdus alkalitolerans]